MRTISLILASGLLLSTVSVAGSSEGNLPGVGTFAYVDASADLGIVAPRGPLVFTAAAK
jgi:hypothetical protein